MRVFTTAHVEDHRRPPVGITSLPPCGAPGSNLGALIHLACHVGIDLGSHAAQAGPELGKACVAKVELELLILPAPPPKRW